MAKKCGLSAPAKGFLKERCLKTEGASNCSNEIFRGSMQGLKPKFFSLLTARLEAVP
jgi:hypothetical protein